MPPVGFEPTIPASAWPQTYALDRAGTGIGVSIYRGGNLANDNNVVVYSENQLNSVDETSCSLNLNQVAYMIINASYVINPLKTKRICFI
jgi:hypothetical protein